MHRTSQKHAEHDIFIAVSYKAACRLDQTATQGYRELLENLTSSFEKHGLRVYLAPREEEWGKTRPPRELGIRKDFSALKGAQVFILFLDKNESDGALVELGMAIALKKFIWILRRESEILSGYLMGILKLELAYEREIASEFSFPEIVKQIAMHAVIAQETGCD